MTLFMKTSLASKGTFLGGTTLPISALIISAFSVVAADVNDDGHVDLITANSYDSTLTLLTNNGNGKYSTAATISVGSSPNCVLVADVNGDGKPDLISGNGGTLPSTVTVVTNNGDGTFAFSGTFAV